MRKGYVYITAMLPIYDFWDPFSGAQFDPQVLEDDINEDPSFTVTDRTLVNRGSGWFAGQFKEADVWFRCADNALSKVEIKNRLRDAVKSNGRRNVEVKKLILADVTDDSWGPGEIPPGTYPDGGMPTWQVVTLTTLVVGFIFALLDIVAEY